MSENNGTRHRNPGGRPSKSIREGMEVIVKALRVGASRAAAAACARIDEGTLNEWLERYPNFDQDINKAEAELEIRMVQDITSRKVGWEAAAYILERRYPERWGQQQLLTADDKKDVVIRVVYYAPDGKPISQLGGGANCRRPKSVTLDASGIVVKNGSKKD